MSVVEVVVFLRSREPDNGVRNPPGIVFSEKLFPAQISPESLKTVTPGPSSGIKLPRLLFNLKLDEIRIRENQDECSRAGVLYVRAQFCKLQNDQKYLQTSGLGNSLFVFTKLPFTWDMLKKKSVIFKYCI